MAALKPDPTLKGAVDLAREAGSHRPLEAASAGPGGRPLDGATVDRKVLDDAARDVHPHDLGTDRG